MAIAGAAKAGDIIYSNTPEKCRPRREGRCAALQAQRPARHVD